MRKRRDECEPRAKAMVIGVEQVFFYRIGALACCIVQRLKSRSKRLPSLAWVACFLVELIHRIRFGPFCGVEATASSMYQKTAGMLLLSTIPTRRRLERLFRGGRQCWPMLHLSTQASSESPPAKRR